VVDLQDKGWIEDDKKREKLMPRTKTTEVEEEPAIMQAWHISYVLNPTPCLPIHSPLNRSTFTTTPTCKMCARKSEDEAVIGD
jgi:hypothetical protein